MARKKWLNDENGNRFSVSSLTSAEQKVLEEIWDSRDIYESIDFSRLPLLAEYAKIFCAMQAVGDAMRDAPSTINKDEKKDDLENLIGKYSKLQKVVFEYRKLLGLDKIKPKRESRWEELMRKRMR